MSFVFPTNASQVQAFAGALYGVQVGSTTMAQVNADIAANGGLATTLNSYYSASFGGVANATVANTVATNLGLTGAALTSGAAYITAQLNAAAAGARGQVISSIVNLFGTLSADATFGAAATAWNTKVAAAAAYTGTANVAIGTVVAAPDAVFTLTTGTNTFTGTSGNDTFDAGLSTGSLQTLNSGDRLDGGAGTDSLFAVINGSVTPALLANVENVQITNTAAGSVIDFTNATGVVNLTNQGSSNTTTMSGVNKAIAVTVADTTFDQTVTYAATTGTADAVTISVKNVVNATADSLTVAGIETLTIDSTGTNTLGALTTAAAAGVGMTTSAATKVVVTGAGTTTLGALGSTVATFDASAATGAVSVEIASTVANNVTGGAGNDTIYVGASGAADTVIAGAGDDTVRFTANWTTSDVVTGGDGTDTLQFSTASDAVVAAAPTTFRTSGFETITVTSQLANATYSVPNIDAGATRFNITGQTGAGTTNVATAAALTTGAPTITGPAGSFTVGLGASVAANTLGALAHALTVNDTGTGTADSLTILNSARVTNGAQVDVFANQNIVVGGYETVTINTGAVAGTYMTFGTVAITADQAAPTRLVLTGANALEVGAVTAGTIDASGITAAGTGSTNSTAAFFMTTGNTATNITGSAGFDVLVGHSTASTINGGAGNDSIVGGAAGDSLLGGDGDDTIDGAAGNDNIDGGAGNDRVLLSTDGDLTAADTINGGEGTDTLAWAHVATSNTAGDLSGVSGFEVFEFAPAGTETLNLTDFVTNSTFTRVDFGQVGTGTATLNSVGAGVTDIRLLVGAAGDTLVFDRLVDNSTNSVTISVRGDLGGAAVVTALTIDDEETVTISGSTSANDLLVTTLNAADLRTLTITGDADIGFANAVVGSNVATVNAAGSTGALEVHLTNNAVQATMTAGTGAAEFTGGLLADVINGGSAADTIIGGSGADTINGGAGNDRIQGSTGADVINVGSGTDTLTFGDDGDTGTLTSVSGAISLTGVDVITGMGNNDTIITTGLGYTTVGAAGATQMVAAFSTSTLADNAGVILRGNWAAGSTTGSGTFIGNSTGADTLFIVDANNATGAQSYEAIVLVGTVATAATGTAAAGVVTVTLTV